MVVGGCEQSSSVNVVAAQAIPLPAPSCDGYPRTSANAVTICEERSYGPLPATGNAGIRSDGGVVQARGGFRTDLMLDAFVYATAPTEEAAREVAAQVVVHTENNDFHATGPANTGSVSTGCAFEVGGSCVADGSSAGTTWTVSFVALLPFRTDLTASTISGLVEITSIDGTSSFSSTSGALVLTGLAGEVMIDSTSGAVDVDLTGSSWRGAGMTVDTNSGAVVFHAPADYSARFEFSSDSGSIHSDFSGTTTSGSYSETLGNGGATLGAESNSGSIHLRRK